MKKVTIIILLSFLIFGCFSVNKNFESTNFNGVQIFTESGYNLMIIKKNKMKFGVSEQKPENSDFFINSNFFTNESPIGLVVVDGTRMSKRTKRGGYFYVVDGIPYVRSNFCPKKTQFASQTILWAIDNGSINEELLTKSHAKLKRYRTIMGENSKGEIMIISSSSFFSLVTIEELINFSISKGMIEGILLDGGTSVDYRFSNKLISKEFSSVPEILKPVFGIHKPTTYIYGNLN